MPSETSVRAGNLRTRHPVDLRLAIGAERPACDRGPSSACPFRSGTSGNCRATRASCDSNNAACSCRPARTLRSGACLLGIVSRRRRSGRSPLAADWQFRSLIRPFRRRRLFPSRDRGRGETFGIVVFGDEFAGREFRRQRRRDRLLSRGRRIRQGIFPGNFASARRRLRRKRRWFCRRCCRRRFSRSRDLP